MLVNFEQNRMFRNIQNFELFDQKKEKKKKKKKTNHFGQRVDAILEDVSVLKIFWNNCLMPNH